MNFFFFHKLKICDTSEILLHIKEMEEIAKVERNQT